MPSQRAPDIYVSMLMPRVRGYPLWRPDTPSNHPLGGIQIGDLGYLDNEGGFVYLFNVCKAANDPVNQNRTPPGFVQLTDIDCIADISTERLFGNNQEFHAVVEKKKSIGVDVSAQASFVPAALGSCFQFTSASTRAALLVLPDGATSHTCEKPDILKNYAITYGHSWYEYFNGLGQGRHIPNGMLYLVTGCSKCRSWANACYSHTVKSRAASLNLSIAGGGANVSGKLYCKWEVQSDSPVHHRSHPEPPTSVPYVLTPFALITAALIPLALITAALIPLALITTVLTPALVAVTLIVAAVLLRPDPENQTIFLRGYSISVSEPSLKKLRFEAKVEVYEKLPQDSSIRTIPCSAAPQSTTTSAATETGIAQGHGAGMGTARSLNFDDSEIEGSSYDDYSGSGGSETLEDETESDVPVLDIPYGSTTMKSDTLVQRLPPWGKIVNPSALINQHILNTYPDATIALTHDDFQWTGMEDNVQNPLNAMELAKYIIDNSLVSINKSETTPNAWVAKRRDTDIDGAASSSGAEKTSKDTDSDHRGMLSEAGSADHGSLVTEVSEFPAAENKKLNPSVAMKEYLLSKYEQDTDMSNEELRPKIKSNLDATISKRSSPAAASISSSLHVNKEKIHMDGKDASQEVDTDTAIDDTPLDLVPVLLSYEQLGPGHDVTASNIWQDIILFIPHLLGAIIITICKILWICYSFFATGVPSMTHRIMQWFTSQDLDNSHITHSLDETLSQEPVTIVRGNTESIVKLERLEAELASRYMMAHSWMIDSVQAFNEAKARAFSKRTPESKHDLHQISKLYKLRHDPLFQKSSTASLGSIDTTGSRDPIPHSHVFQVPEPALGGKARQLGS